MESYEVVRQTALKGGRELLLEDVSGAPKGAEVHINDEVR